MTQDNTSLPVLPPPVVIKVFSVQALQAGDVVVIHTNSDQTARDALRTLTAAIQDARAQGLIVPRIPYLRLWSDEALSVQSTEQLRQWLDAEDERNQHTQAHIHFSRQESSA